jgi:hypothetical protein
MMRAIAIAGVAALVLQGCSGQEKTVDVSPEVMDSNTREAREGVKVFFGELKGELVSAIQAGGPAHAVDVCNTKAGEIAARVSRERGMALSRVSLKNRNPGNAPNDWQRDVLEMFEKDKAAGSDPSKLEYRTVVATADGNQFRYMKAIPTAEVCLNCHGAELAPAGQAKIDELYPDDKATGYAVGDLRGAFVVTRDL